MRRRNFIQEAISWAGLSVLSNKNLSTGFPFQTQVDAPLVLSTWAPNVKANAAAWQVLVAGGRALDAVEAGVKIPEADPDDQSVGYGGLPDRDGRVTLDSCIMDEFGNCGAVMCLEHILHPISVARLVMERTPHVQLVGEGALQFALAQGFTKTNLLTPKAEAAWRNWLKTSKYNPMITVDQLQQRKSLPVDQVPGQINNHDTIGMIALDAKGNLSGACTTSGMAFKMHGRVGDSPIVGAGLFVDNEVGAATATGVGEEMVRMCGSHTIVELMRQGYTPDEACKQAIERVIRKHGEAKARSLQVGFLALRKDGRYGAASVVKGFNYAYRSQDGEKVFDAKPVLHG
jgi:N4-(beta-N-acetylglucosaminyl)-L-asparaginase